MSSSTNYVPPGQARFNWGRHLGSGGLGRVDEGIVTQSTMPSLPVGARFAVKRLNPQWANHPEARTRFEREINALRTMAHPNIVTLKGESLPESNERYYGMPLFPRSLRSFLTSRGAAFPWANVAESGAELADALAHAHSRGFIHRDIKPENILLTKDNVPVIADWGLGYFIHKESKVLQQLTQAGMGTEYYCSLEQWDTGKCTATGDVYSLGVMLAELASGHQVPLAMGYAGSGIGVDVVVANSKGAKLFNDIIKKMTEFLASRRIQSMTEVAQQLRLSVAYANIAL